jgi:hypothetical protein
VGERVQEFEQSKSDAVVIQIPADSAPVVEFLPRWHDRNPRRLDLIDGGLDGERVWAVFSARRNHEHRVVRVDVALRADEPVAPHRGFLGHAVESAEFDTEGECTSRVNVSAPECGQCCLAVGVPVGRVGVGKFGTSLGSPFLALARQM